MPYIDESNFRPLSKGSLGSSVRFWIKEFLEQKDLDKVSEKTLKSYSDALLSFIDFVDTNSDNTMENMGATFINRYLIWYQASLAENDYKKGLIDKKEYIKISKQVKDPSLGKYDAGFYIGKKYENTLNHRLTVVKMLLRYISENNKEEKDYTTLFRRFATIRIKERFQNHLKVEEVDKIIDFMMVWPEEYKKFEHCHIYKNYTYHDAMRDGMLLLIYLLTGARGGEVIKVKLKDIEPSERMGDDYFDIKIENGKGDKIRRVSVHRDYIEKYVNYFKSALPSDEFCISSVIKDEKIIDKPIHVDIVRRFANLILQELDINKTGLHSFRRGFATRKVVHEKENIAVVARLMGNTTTVLEKYYVKDI